MAVGDAVMPTMMAFNLLDTSNADDKRGHLQKVEEGNNGGRAGYLTNPLDYPGQTYDKGAHMHLLLLGHARQAGRWRKRNSAKDVASQGRMRGGGWALAMVISETRG